MPVARRTRTPSTGPAERAGWLSIGALARCSGIPAETLRTWERRYGTPAPVRKPSGHRLYPAREATRLARVSELLERGHRAVDVLPLPEAKLDALLALAGRAERVPAPARAARRPARRDASPATGALLAAARALDDEALRAGLRAAWKRRAPLAFLLEVAHPLMAEIGDLWERGAIGIRHEHLASATLNGFLREARAALGRGSRGRRVVLATLPGETHAGGMLMAGVLLAARGRRVLDLGTDLPPEQVAESAADADAEAVVVSVSRATAGAQSAQALAALRAALPRGIALWVGGAGAPAAVAGGEVFRGLEPLDRRLASRARRPASRR